METTKTPYQKSLDLIFGKFKKHNNDIVKFFTSYDQAYYELETAPGKNRASYLLGHLTVANDELFPFLGLGEMQHPQLLNLYFSADRVYPDREYLAVTELLGYFQDVNNKLEEKFKAMPPEIWLDKHTRVSDQDFAADPMRSKLGVLLNRLIHLNHHLGQLRLLPMPWEIGLKGKS